MEINQSNLQAAFTSFSLSFNQGFQMAESTYEQVATTTNSTTDKTMYPWLGKTTWFSEWFGERTLQSLEAHQYTLKNRDFENTVTVSRNDFLDDQYGVYAKFFEQLGDDAKAHPDSLIYPLLANGFTNLCYDGQPFFNANHPVENAQGGGYTMVSNYNAGGPSVPWFLLDTSRPLKPLIFQKRQDYKFVSMVNDQDEFVFNRKEYRYGVDCRVQSGYGFWQYAYCSTQTLNQANFSAAKAAMRNFKADNGQPMNVKPNLLVVPPSLELTALNLLNAAMIPNAQGTAAQSNVLTSAAKLIVTPWVGA